MVINLIPDPKNCVYIGYPEEVKGYRLWLRRQPGFKMIISRDVVFNKSKLPCLSKTTRKDEDYNVESTFNKVEKPIEDNQQEEENREERNTDNESLENSENSNPSENQYLLARHRERREPRIPSKFRDFHLALNIESFGPTTYDEASKLADFKQWIRAINEEIKSLHEKKTWVLVPKSANVSI
ncbi:UNVERIFIED_CONTAM: hypothetical protein Sindi_1456300, partial [Sesamum indicum]